MAEDEVLVAIARRCGAELSEGAALLRRSGEGVVVAVNAKVGQAQSVLNAAQPQLDQTKGAVVDLSPVPVEAATGIPVLGSLVWTGVSLGAMGVGQALGRHLGGVLLSWWLSAWVAVLTTFVTIPAVYVGWSGDVGLAGKDRRLGTLAAASAMGVLSGFSLRNFGTSTWEPAALGALVVAAGLRFLAPQLASQADRKALVGATLGATAAVQLGLALLGPMSAASLIYIILVTGVLGVQLQLVVARQAAPSAANEWVVSMLPIFVISAVLFVDSLVSTTFAPPNDQ